MNSIKTYNANPKYLLSILFCLAIFSIPTLFALIDWFRFNSKGNFIGISVVFSIISSAYILIIARKITITDNNLKVKTLLLNRTIPIEKIKSVTKTYSTKSMIWYSNDKNKAHMLCSVRFGHNPLAFFVIHNGINEYKELCEKIDIITNT